MSAHPSPDVPFEQRFEIYGVPVAIGASDREVLDRLVGLLPAGVKPCGRGRIERRFTVSAVSDGVWTYNSGNGRSPTYADLELVVSMLDRELRNYIASVSTELVFVHAGAVAHRGRAIVIPGKSFSGKSTLVAALAQAGAVYYSDEYAVLDDRGRVHPYARPLAIREPDAWEAVRHSIESFGAKAGTEPVPVGLIAATRYRPAAEFSPERRTAGQGTLALLANAGSVNDRPAETLAAVRRAAGTALVVEGDRGEADAAAQALLEIADRAFRNGAGPDP
jgi:hypothetical protein